MISRREALRGGGFRNTSSGLVISVGTWKSEAEGHGETKMLVLSRKTGERILIGDDVAITVVRIGPNSVRVGIEAPRSTNVVREELCNFDDADNKSESNEALPL